MGYHPLPDKSYLKLRRNQKGQPQCWYVRVVVPRELRDTLRRLTVEHSLHTGDKREAQRARHAVLAKIFADFDRARAGQLASSDIEQEAQRFLRDTLERILKRPEDAFTELEDNMGNPLGLAGERVLGDLRDDLEQEDWSANVCAEAKEIARRYGTSPQKELYRALQRAEIEALSRALAVHQGAIPEPVQVLNSKAVDPVTAALRPVTRLSPIDGPGLRVKEAADGFIAERNRLQEDAWTAQTLHQARATFRFFDQFTSNRPLVDIKRKDIANFLTAIAGLDPNYGRRSRNMSLQQIMKAHPAKAGEGISNKTLMRHAALIAGMFDWAIDNEQYEGPNPARSHGRRNRRSANRGKSDARRPFHPDELNRLFNATLFKTAIEDRVTPARHTVETSLAWLIPIALFSGMRLDEICGMRVADVIQEDGILYFNLESHEERRLKTAAARRRIPVHSELLRLGFETYLEHVRRQRHIYLFPALKPGGPDKKRSWYISKRYTVLRRSVGVSAPETTFHSFRHNAATALERARVPENEAAQIMGHRQTTMTFGGYSGGLDLAGLARVVEAISYPGLDLAPLYAPKKAARKE